MANSSYYLYEKYIQFGEQTPIPMLPLEYSVNGDGTQPLVMKSSADTECGASSPTPSVYYRTIVSGYTCVGYDKYGINVYQRSTDNVNWTTISSSTGSLIARNSSDCGYIGHYSRTINSGTTCVQGDLHNISVYQTSVDGVNWTTVSSSTGSLIASASSQCMQTQWVNIPIGLDYICSACPQSGYAERWIALPLGDASTYYCSGTTKYYKEKKQISYDSGTTWADASPMEYRMGGVAEEQSEDCGYIEPIYRTFATATTCVQYDKYRLLEYKVSYDNGVSWTTLSSATGSLIERLSRDCGVDYRYADDPYDFVCEDSSTELYRYVDVPNGDFICDDDGNIEYRYADDAYDFVCDDDGRLYRYADTEDGDFICDDDGRKYRYSLIRYDFICDKDEKILRWGDTDDFICEK